MSGTGSFLSPGGTMTGNQIVSALENQVSPDKLPVSALEDYLSAEQISLIEQGRKLALAMIGVSNNVSDSAHDLDFVDPSGIFASGTVTKRTDATFTAGNNGGCLDTGALAADTVYYLFVIEKIADGTYDFLASTSRNPTPPTGYQSPKFFFAFITNSLGEIIQFEKIGLEWVPDTYPSIDASDTSTSDRTFETASITAPIKCDALVSVQASHGAGQTNLGELLRSDNESAETGTSFADKFNILSSGVMTLSQGSFWVRLSETTDVKYAVGKTGAGTTTVTVRVRKFRIPLEEVGA